LINAVSKLPGPLQQFIHQYYPKEETKEEKPAETQEAVIKLLFASLKN